MLQWNKYKIITSSESATSLDKGMVLNDKQVLACVSSTNELPHLTQAIFEKADLYNSMVPKNDDLAELKHSLEVVKFRDLITDNFPAISVTFVSRVGIKSVDDIISLLFIAMLSKIFLVLVSK